MLVIMMKNSSLIQGKWTVKKIILFYFILVISTLIFISLIDITYPYIIVDFTNQDNAKTKILVIDVAGILGNYTLSTSDTIISKELSVNSFRILGASKARVIVIVAHGFSLLDNTLFSEKKSFALETTQNPGPLTIFLHPVLIISSGVVIGKISNKPGKHMVVVTRNIFRYSLPFKNKTIVLIACGGVNIDRFSEEFLTHGARAVIYNNKPMSYGDARKIVELIIREYKENPSLLITNLRELGLITI